MSKKLSLFLITTVLCCQYCFAQDIKAIKTNESFAETAHIDILEQIKINTMPRTTYTPTNLRTQYNMSFQGRNTSTGAMTWWSNTFTDYDTKITSSELVGDSYYIHDNAGNSFKTGEHVDLAPIQKDINDAIQRIDTQSKELSGVNNRIDDVERNLYSGLATVSALTSLHPNPRSTEPVELSVGVGTFRDQCAGAAGLFIHPTNRVMLQGGFAFGNRDNYAGYAGITIGLPWFHKK